MNTIPLHRVILTYALVCFAPPTPPKNLVLPRFSCAPPPPGRHDWVVKRADGTEARYVIDFYAGKAPPGSNMPVAMHLDVRPALDSYDVSQAFAHQPLYLFQVVGCCCCCQLHRLFCLPAKACRHDACMSVTANDVIGRPSIAATMCLDVEAVCSLGYIRPRRRKKSLVSTCSRPPQSERVTSSIDRRVSSMHACSSSHAYAPEGVSARKTDYSPPLHFFPCLAR